MPTPIKTVRRTAEDDGLRSSEGGAGLRRALLLTLYEKKLGVGIL